MAEEKLTIHKLTFNIEFGAKSEFHHFANRISSLCKYKLPQKLNEILKRHKLPNGKLVIHKLDIDLEQINHHYFEKTILDNVSLVINEAIGRYALQIESDLKQARFKNSVGEKVVLKKSGFTFESEIFLEKSVHIKKQLQLAKEGKIKLASVNLNEQIHIKNQAIIEEIKAFQRAQKADKTQIGSQASPIAPLAAKEIEEEEKASLDLNQAVTLKEAQDSPTNIPSSLSEEATKEESKIVSQLTDVKAKSEEKPPAMLDINERIPVAKDADAPKEKKQEKDYLPSLPSKTKVENVEDALPKPQSETSLNKIDGYERSSPSEDDEEQFVLNLDSRKMLTELDKAFLYYIKYGRLPSNIKYELGTSMLDVYKVNKENEKFFAEIKRRIDTDKSAKERLIRVMDEENKKDLVKKTVLGPKDIEEFDPSIPKSFEDYFVALAMDLDTSFFAAGIQRYNFNDMVNFLYATSPLKLRSILQYVLLKFPSNRNFDERLDSIFEISSKPSINKMIATFLRKAGFLAKDLNSLNKVKRKDRLHFQKILLRKLLRSEIFNTEDYIPDSKDRKHAKFESIVITPRRFNTEAPTYDNLDMSKEAIIEYYLSYGALPYSTGSITVSLDRLSVLILSLSKDQIQNLPFFKDKKEIKYETFGKISEQAIKHILSALAPSEESEIHNKFKYFEHNIVGGVPEEFQKSFMIYYATKSSKKSYLEEMIQFWKEQFGDADRIIRKRWKVKKQLDEELGKIIHFQDESLEEQMKVSYEFQDYSEDISVKNAGLVILWPFLKIYFNMLNLLNPEGDFRSLDERARACHLLQYLAVKQAGGEEFYYPLNKILTGYPLEESLPPEIKMTEKEKDVSLALLKNVLKQWPALAGSTVDGLRGSFLIRDGVLSPTEKGWLLTVEKKAYDLIMNKMPWGFSMIKLSWAPYIINVEWDRDFM